MTPQEIFDRSVSGLIKQGARSVDYKNTCLYRSPCGNRCAIGLLIPDEHYTPSIETKGITAFLEIDYLLVEVCKQSGIDLNSRAVFSLVTDLQVMHDTFLYNCAKDEDFVDYVKRKSLVIAAKHDLTPLTV
jgi:hypothetical protein